MGRDSPSWHTSIKICLGSSIFPETNMPLAVWICLRARETGNGNTTIIAGFSVYPDYGACIRQRGWMLNREPYAGKVAPYRNHNDKKYTKEAARGFMNGIRAAGWATDSSYVEKCVQHMDNYNLYRFDNMTYEEYQKSGGGNYDGTVTPLMQSIVDHAANNQGIYPCTPDMCAQWVTGIYQAAGAPTIPYGNAIDMWNNYKNTGNTSMENIPPGAIVCGSGYGTMGSIYGHVGLLLGMEWWPITGAIFPWKVWKNGAVGRPQPVRDIQGGSAGCSRWSSGKLEQKERKNQYEQSSFDGETDTGSGSTIFSGRVSHCSGKIYAGSGAKVQTGRRADSRLYSLCSIREIGRICREIFRQGLRISVSGRIQTGSYTNKEGIKVYTTEVVVEEQEFAESRAEQGRENQGAMGAPDANGFPNIPDGIDEELPFH